MRLLILNFLTGVCLIYPHTAQAGQQITIDTLLGDWFHKAYIDTLLVTKSPRKALRGNYHTALTFAKNNSLFEWGVFFNFHEGYRYRITGLIPVKEPDTYIPVFDEFQGCAHYYENDRFIILKEKPDELIWIFNYRGEEHHIPFIKGNPEF